MTASMPSAHMPHTDLALLAKLGSIAVHIAELWSYQPPLSETVDVLATRQLLADPDITGWLAEMTSLGFMPIKRKQLTQDEEDISTQLMEKPGRLEVTREYLRSPRSAPGYPSEPFSSEEQKRVRRLRKQLGWTASYDPPQEIVPSGFRIGDRCPVCPGVIGGGHMRGCFVGGCGE